jgi:hypothetical protein
MQDYIDAHAAVGKGWFRLSKDRRSTQGAKPGKMAVILAIEVDSLSGEATISRCRNAVYDPHL